jgi:hypothetical protein
MHPDETCCLPILVRVRNSQLSEVESGLLRKIGSVACLGQVYLVEHAALTWGRFPWLRGSQPDREVIGVPTLEIVVT